MEAFFNSLDLLIERNEIIFLVSCCVLVFFFVFWEEIKKSFKKKGEGES